ncbi:PREDICTED: uncharacterized protein LOC104611076 isoform X2 [Nelumbo nucifera]|uniref:Uncharacterized protein LOC104611076 isoform X2 n=1 Tax=Nelumbo nucifera TaxID=4432 RepID=A0A1U8B5S5_NELNU|nr:PREDICTED: uncharacterized protein LOC104611076 isoform X2 [Nelumbo nucifera]
MMTHSSSSQDYEFRLLGQLEHILESDTLIDEVGFVHPTQLVALKEEAGSSINHVSSSQQSEHNMFMTDPFSHDGTIFWNQEHKLAISTEVIFPLYNAAKNAFLASVEQYKMLINLPAKTDNSVAETVQDQHLASKHFLESEVMKHSKALLLLSCDFGTAWNSRKLVVLQEILSLFMDELKLSALILSYSPKSDHAWSHRRWVIKSIAGKCPNLQEIVVKESELVEKIAERSKMNYRAWHHRCWLVSYMTKDQRLMLRMLEDICLNQENDLCSSNMMGLYKIWKEELDWDEMLIKRYIGREALWVHRRFLSQYWVKHFVSNIQYTPCHSEDDHSKNRDMYIFMDNEVELLHTCLAVLDDDFEDGQAQVTFVAAYVFWMSKQIPHSQRTELEEKLKRIGDLRDLLNKVDPAKAQLWNGLMS